MIDRQKDRQADRQIDRRTDTQTDRQTDRQTDGQIQLLDVVGGHEEDAALLEGHAVDSVQQPATGPPGSQGAGYGAVEGHKGRQGATWAVVGHKTRVKP